jgi:hypothetical protein
MKEDGDDKRSSKPFSWCGDGEDAVCKLPHLYALLRRDGAGCKAMVMAPRRMA